jgi:hypothetical protein
MLRSSSAGSDAIYSKRCQRRSKKILIADESRVSNRAARGSWIRLRRLGEVKDCGAPFARQLDAESTCSFHGNTPLAILHL